MPDDGLRKTMNDHMSPGNRSASWFAFILDLVRWKARHDSRLPCPRPAQAKTSLQRGISKLASMQQPDGGFPVYRRAGGRRWHDCHALFSTLTVLLATGDLLPESALARAVNFVLHCRRSDGTWEFDRSLGIPADSDDTACALAVLARYGTGLVDAADASLLRSFWLPDGGPFQTWNSGGEWASRQRDDAVVNCNVILALRALGSPPGDDEVGAVVELIRRSEGGCRYYCSPVTITYAASRAGVPLDMLPSGLFKRPAAGKTVLPTAQWLSFSQRWDQAAVGHLLAAQGPDGEWATEPWFTGAGRPVPVWGSPAVSTALCIEALQCALAAPPQ
jgi:hypothetical protein